MPKSYKALEVFARHNSDLGANGHGYRRKESVDFAPEAKLFLKELKANAKITNLNKVEGEFRTIVEASYVLLNSSDNPVLIDEIRPWVKQFRLLGEAGLSMVSMEKALQAKQPSEFERSYTAVKAIKSQMYSIYHEDNQNPYQPGVKTATRVVAPMIDKGFAYLTKAYNKEFGSKLKVEANYNPHQLFTNVAQLQNQALTLKNRKLSLNPPLEIIHFKPKAYVGFELGETTKIKRIVYKLDPSGSYKNIDLEVSEKGKEWEVLSTKKVKGGMQASVKRVMKYIRIRNKTSKNIETKIKWFTVQFK